MCLCVFELLFVMLGCDCCVIVVEEYVWYWVFLL